MLSNSFASIAKAVPKPLRQTARRWIIPPVLKTLRYVRGINSQYVHATRFSVPGHETFAGYYDISPISGDEGALFAHAGEQLRRALRADDRIRVGYFNLADGRFVDIAQTSLWCWQLGSRLRWWPEGERTLAFNMIYNGKPSFCAASRGMEPRSLCDMPVFDVTRDGKFAISLNFGRLASARPGYGYPAMADPFAGELLPARDGVTFIDIDNGKSQLLYSMQEFSDLAEDSAPDEFHYLNAASLSPAGRRFSVLYKRMLSANDPFKWKVDAVIGEIDGSHLRRVPLPGSASHYWWIDDERIAYTTSGRARNNYWIYDTGTQTVVELLPGAPRVDGHPSQCDKHGTWVTDTYPDLYGEQSLYLLAASKAQPMKIGCLAADPRYADEWRCDLHPRWSPDGSKIVVDSTHEGFRAIYLIEARPYL